MRGLGNDRGGERVVLLLTVFAEDRFGLNHEWSLRGVGGKSLLLALKNGVDVERDGPGCGRGNVTVREEKICRDVIEALRGEERAEVWVALGVAGPVEGRGGEGGNHGVVGVGVQGAITTEGEDDMRAEGADALDQLAGDLRKVGVLKFAVLVADNFVVLDAKNVAGGGELSAAEDAELFVGFSVATIAAGGAGGEADGGDFDAAVGCECECAAEGEAFVVGVGKDAEKTVTHFDRTSAACNPAFAWGGPFQQFKALAVEAF